MKRPPSSRIKTRYPWNPLAKMKREGAAYLALLKTAVRSEGRTLVRRRDIERVDGQSDQAVVAYQRDCLDQLLATQFGERLRIQRIGQRVRAQQSANDFDEQTLVSRQSLQRAVRANRFDRLRLVPTSRPLASCRAHG